MCSIRASFPGAEINPLVSLDFFLFIVWPQIFTASPPQVA